MKGVTIRQGKRGDGAARWQAQLTHKSTNFYLGTYPNPTAAARAYDAKARSVGLYHLLNFPDDDAGGAGRATRASAVGEEDADAADADVAKRDAPEGTRSAEGAGARDAADVPAVEGGGYGMEAGERARSEEAGATTAAGERCDDAAGVGSDADINANTDDEDGDATMVGGVHAPYLGDPAGEITEREAVLGLRVVVRFEVRADRLARCLRSQPLTSFYVTRLSGIGRWLVSRPDIGASGEPAKLPQARVATSTL